jgi:hypothetical protein
MAFALRCVFFLLVLVALGALLVLYRRRVNVVLLGLLGIYAVGVGRRLLEIEGEDELLWQSLLAVGGLGVVWLAVWLGARWFERRGGSI